MVNYTGGVSCEKVWILVDKWGIGGTLFDTAHFTVNFRIVGSESGVSYLGGGSTRAVRVHESREGINRIVEEGFLVRSDLFSVGTLNDMRAALERIEREGCTHADAEHISGNGFYIRYLYDKAEIFRDSMFFEPTLSIARALLGLQVWFGVDARIVYAGEPAAQVPWHIHKRVVPDPLPPFFSYPHVVDFLLYLDDAGPNEGGLVVLPGSHRDHRLDLAKGGTTEASGQEVLYPRAGDCVIMHTNLWYRTYDGRVSAALPRYVRVRAFLIEERCRQGVKPECPLTAPLRSSDDPEVLELLDEFHW